MVAPGLVAAAPPILALAVCPLAMLMMKGMHGTRGETHGRQTFQETDTGLTREEQIARLWGQQAALADRIGVLERDEPRPTKNGKER